MAPAKELFIATANKHKVIEISEIIGKYGVSLVQKDIPLIEPSEGTLEDIAIEKARQAFAELKTPVIAEDTGVYFNEYKDFPGLMAKRVYLQLGFKGLLGLVKAAEDKGAYFKTVICFMWGTGETEHKLFAGECKGRLLEEVVSLEKDRLPYEKIFVPEGYEKAMVDIPREEKNKMSHRAKAAEELGEYLKTADF
ncbi:MAG: non-canonical purine NTP pyrophosphatase [Candidatus Diapherotrites archaeon]|nr:non-canonical purine NTP pyrophosphatase [Candidatus Micrarchaeota archaeon]MBU1940039.1 non-canonical purine NTP pyrophosphatase [Candidatus Micrarchaeota archaeon]